jgi:hypothetical protein
MSLIENLSRHCLPLSYGPISRYRGKVIASLPTLGLLTLAGLFLLYPAVLHPSSMANLKTGFCGQTFCPNRCLGKGAAAGPVLMCPD